MIETWWPLLVVLLVLGWYLSYTASRLDRLHAKVTAARTALDVQLLRRRMAAIEAARYLDPASALLVTAAASQALTAAEQDDEGRAGEARDPLDVPPYLEPMESEVSRALVMAFPEPSEAPAADRAWPPLVGGPGQTPFADDARRQLVQSCARVQLARRLHNDAVAQAQRVRDKRVVRWAHLAGRAPVPQMIDFDDALPPGLSQV
ncbi:MAG: hypothetical protein IPK24_13475 [Kineosporiaceae bacterium]|nr:hypothetical protein [Kineosporiaceae bacterium]